MIFKNVGIMPNEKKDADFSHTKNLVNFLEKKCINIYFSEFYSKKINNYAVKYIVEEKLYEVCDLIIVLGGDGTILRYANCGKPIIGINLGRIGFMSAIELHEIELLDVLFDGSNNFKIEERMMIDVYIMQQNGKIMHVGTGLNDAVLSGNIARLIDLELACNGEKFMNYRADGIIIAAPTGSTAYSMSAGGPIIDPNIACLCITPVCPHSLINRPVIFSGNAIIDICAKFENNVNNGENFMNKNGMNVNNSEIYLSIDGKNNIKLDEKDVVRIKRSEKTAKLLSVKNRGLFDVIRAKMFEN